MWLSMQYFTMYILILFVLVLCAASLQELCDLDTVCTCFIYCITARIVWSWYCLYLFHVLHHCKNRVILILFVVVSYTASLRELCDLDTVCTCFMYCITGRIEKSLSMEHVINSGFMTCALLFIKVTFGTDQLIYWLVCKTSGGTL